MAIVKEIQINLTDDDAKKGLNDINKLFKEVSKSEEQAVQSTKSLRTQLRELQQQLASGQLKGEEFRQASIRAGELRDAIGDANQRINALASDTGRLDALVQAGTGIAGAFSAAQGAAALFGQENEEVQQAILKVQSSLALLNGVQAVANTLNKDSALMVQLQTRGLAGLVGVQGLYTKAVGTSTGVLKAFRIALVSTGIGALVVGIGLLVANFEKVSKWVTDLIEKFGGWRKMLMTFLPVIGLVVKGLEAIGVIDDEATAKAKKNAEDRIKAQRKESAELDKRKNQLEGYYDFEIRKAKASGQNTEVVEQQKRRALLDTLKAQNELERAWIRTGQASAEDIKRWNERQKEITKLIQDIQVAEIEGQTKANEARKKANEELRNLAKQRAEDAKKIEQQRLDAIAKINEDFDKRLEDKEDLTEIQKIERQKVRQLAELERLKASEAEKQKVIDFFEAEKDKVLQQKETERQAKIAEIENEFYWKRREQEALNDEQRMQLEIDKLEAQRLAKEQEFIQLGIDEETRLNLLQTYLTEEERIRDAFRASELQKEEILKQQKIQLVSDSLGLLSDLLGRNSKIGQKFAIAQALYNTYQGVTAELQTQTNTPFEFGLKLFNIAKVLSVGLNAVRQIKSTNPMGGGSGSPSIGSGGGATPTAAPQFNTIGNNPVSQIAEAVGNQPPVQAFVVGSQVTSQQALDRNIITNASLG